MGVAQVPAAMQAELGLPDRESVGETLSRCPHFRSRQIVTTLWGCGRSSWASASDGNRGAAVLESLLRSRLRLPLSHPVSAPLPQPKREPRVARLSKVESPGLSSRKSPLPGQTTKSLPCKLPDAAWFYFRRIAHGRLPHVKSNLRFGNPSGSSLSAAVSHSYR